MIFNINKKLYLAEYIFTIHSFMKYFILLLIVLLQIQCQNTDVVPDEQPESMYFPPNSGTWETMSLENAGFNTAQVQQLLDYLQIKHTKGFIVLKNGKIVMEYYFNGHTATSNWYWASAGKTLTSTVVGIAEQSSLLQINQPVSQYLGSGWTSLTTQKEQLITLKHLLTMTSGLDDSLGDNVSPQNLQYVADAGTRWAYHNVYVKLQDVVAQAAQQTWSQYFNTNLRDKIGMDGIWYTTNDLSVYYSTTRSMARFGLLALNKGKWNNQIIVPENYITSATNTSQNLNLAYGYLWWLNGKSSYRLPQTQLQFSGTLIPNAPQDMYAALGKNDQKIYVVPSKKIVIIRMGEAADDVNFALSGFDNELWSKINLVINN